MSDRIHVNHQHEPTPIKGSRRKIKKYEYKLHTYIAQQVYDEFNRLGEEGWYFIGQCATGASVFVREKL